MQYKVSVGYRDDDDEVRWIGCGVFEACGRKEARSRAMDAFWDDLLDSASCVAVVKVRKTS